VECDRYIPEMCMFSYRLIVITDRRCRPAFRRYKMRTESPNMVMYLLYLDQVSYNAICSLYFFGGGGCPLNILQEVAKSTEV